MRGLLPSADPGLVRTAVPLLGGLGAGVVAMHLWNGLLARLVGRRAVRGTVQAGMRAKRAGRYQGLPTSPEPGEASSTEVI